MAVAHLLSDVRYAINGEHAVSSVASRSLEPKVSTWLATERDDLQAAGVLRRYDTTLDMWIRSETVGPVSSPTRVNVEVVGNLASDPMQFQFWYSTRYDVVREGGAWRLLDYHNGKSGPDTSSNLTPAQQRKYLVGPGWRRIPAADER